MNYKYFVGIDVSKRTLDYSILNDGKEILHLQLTNSIEGLEQFLKKYKGALVMVSHDRMFLDEVTNRTIEIVQQRVFDFKKPYSKYMELREELRAQQQAAQKNQEKQIQQTEKLIERFRAKASKEDLHIDIEE